jgi:hypothetical protein
MDSLLAPDSRSLPAVSFRHFRSIVMLVAGCAASSALLAQADAPEGGGRMRRGQNGDGGGGRGNFNPEEMQQRMLTVYREQMGITDDGEWKLILERITAVTELQRSSMGGGFGGFAGMRGGPGGGGNRGGRGGAANPEQDALRQAIVDKLPDAEVQSRLARLRETRKANEEKLRKAQEELRAVLSIRQEAVAVMVRLLP